MNNIVVLCGLVMLGLTTTPQEESIPNNFENPYRVTDVILAEEKRNLPTEDLETSVLYTPEMVNATKIGPSQLNLCDIDFLEENEEFDLGFDTEAYLPENFDPYTAYFDLDSVVYIEETSIELGFSTSEYLSDTFNPYAYPTDISGFNYIEEEDLDLGYETASYLPANFNAHEFYFDLNSVEYIEEEEEIDFERIAAYYLSSVNSVPSSK